MLVGLMTTLQGAYFPSINPEIETDCFHHLPKTTKLSGLPIPNAVFCYHTKAASFLFEPGMAPFALSKSLSRETRQEEAGQSVVRALAWTLSSTCPPPPVETDCRVPWRSPMVVKNVNSGARLPGFKSHALSRLPA